jgi:glycerate dehydrogenase
MLDTFRKALFLGYNQADFSQAEWARIDTLVQEKILLSKDSPEVAKHLTDVDALLLKLGMGADKQMVDSAPNLRYIGMLGTGYGRIDTTYAASKGITVCNIAGYSTEGVVELAFGVILDQLREIERAKIQARGGDYSEATFQGSEVKGKVFGIIGLGKIGSRIAEIAKHGFGADVRYWNITRKEDYEKQGVRYQEINDLLGEVDFLSLNLAYVPETKGFLNEERISQIKKGTLVINLAPMELVDVNALEKRLQLGDITFILDHSDELTTEQARQLSQYKNCIFYPPIAYTTKEATLVKQKMFVDNLENFLKGSPTNKVN